MEMESLLSTVLNGINSNLPSENQGTVSLKLTDFINRNIDLQNGQSVQIKVNTGSGTLNLVLGDGKTATLPSSSLSLDGMLLSDSETLALDARVVSRQNSIAHLHLTAVNGRPLSQYLREQAAVTESAVSSPQPLIIRESSGLREIPLSELGIKEKAETYISRLPLPENTKDEIGSALAQIGLKVRIESLSSTPQTSGTAEPSVSSSAAGIMSQIALAVSKTAEVASEQMSPEKMAQTLARDIQSLLQSSENNMLPALTAIDAHGETVLTSALGVTKPEISLQLPENLRAELEIIDVVFRSASPLKTTSPADNLLRIVKNIQNENPTLFKMIAEKLPADNENMLSNLASFGKAAAKGDVRQWLGPEIVRELENGGRSGQTVLNELQTVLHESSRQTASWRIVEIPFYAENRMDKIKLAIKQYPEDDNETEDSRKKFGTRFVVDTDFTRLGAFQFDGFSFAKDRRFDLIIRTERDVGSDLCANIMRIFKNTLNDVGYSGNIKVNLKENFIKISEDNNQHKVLSQDLFV